LPHPPLQNNPEPQRAWPWGDDWDAGKANAENGIGETSTPGCFEGGAALRLRGLAGNVWEWTRSLWGTDWRKPDFVYPYDARDLKREDLDAPDDVWRVVRGGSWTFLETSPAAPPAAGLSRALGLAILGFRVVLRSSPVPDSVLCSLWPLSLRDTPTLEGVRGRLPPPRRASDGKCCTTSARST
jgi:formylglycine-generating enzyme required for sulfatase activity